MDRHFQRPSARVRTLQTRYTSFCSGRVKSELAAEDDDDGPGAKGAKASVSLIMLSYPAESRGGDCALAHIMNDKNEWVIIHDMG
jgi:hypothetical protein